MKKIFLLLFLTLFLLTTNEAFSRCRGHYHYHSAPTYLVRSDYFENEQSFANCDEHYLLTKTTVNIYSNGSRITYNTHTVYNNDGSVVLSDCTDIHHIMFNNKHYFLFKKSGKYYIANSKGEIFAKRNYTKMQELSKNRILVRVDKKYGIIDLDENIIVPIKHKSFKQINKNLYITKSNGYYGMINSNGEILLKNEYKKIKPLYDTFVVKKDKKYGLVDINGKIIEPADADKIKKLDEYILVKKDNYYKIYDCTGKLYSNEKYADVRIKNNVLETVIQSS